MTDTKRVRKGVKVNRRLVILIPALILASSLQTNLAVADPKSPPPNTSIDAREIYKLAFDKYKNDLKTYEDKRREINRNFKEAIDIALSDAKSAASGVKSQFQKRQSMSARQNAVIAAISIRDAAIEALGLPPVEPTPPAKAPKIERDKRPKPPISTATPQ
jgi:hypothetical protein